ncbi:N-acetylmuramoyl-L-alanine amidase [Pleurocapsales cyanobacterium LEGE 10410]|nr:N-acetylmuramoyl-L-alanine amidase [Pleurocapsales cyanobacterium LEGE 10410]
MRFHWLLSGFIGAFLFCSPAKAGKIISWEFEEQDNNLVFITDEGVQPEAELLSNPTRLVIDLPGTILGRETVKENYQGAVRGFRIGQPEPDTSRIVVEFAPGYTIDPDDIEFRGISPTHWTVEIPQPEVSRVALSGDDDREVLDLPQVEMPSTLPGLEEASASITTDSSPYIKATKNGFYIGIDGNRKIKIESERNGDRIDFFLEGITLPPDLVSQSVAVNQYGVSTIEFEQPDDEQAVMSLTVAEDSPDWLATFSRIKGLLLVPRGDLPTATATANAPENSTSEAIAVEAIKPERNEFNQIDEIELTNENSELLIHADDKLSAVASRQSNGIYQITIDRAELAEDFKGPQLEAGSPISELKVRQEDFGVVLEITTRLRYRLGQLSSQEQQLALPIEVGVSPPPLNDAPLLPPGFAKAPKDRPFQRVIPPVPVGDRPRVVIDAGHGGKDPGTVGIGGTQEKDIVLPISLDVAEILRKQEIEIIMTRDTDNFISLEGRTDLANDIDADLFVSIHANAINLSRPDVNGLETYYYKSGRRLAEIIHWSILNGVKIDNRNIRRARFYVLRHSTMPAVLVEVGFLTGAVDAARLKDPDYRRQMAEAIARGIVEYIKQNNL